jgi:hypothetical protein
MHRGYIKYWRKIKEWSWYKSPITRCVFLHLISEANHSPYTFMGFNIERGQVVVGRKQLALDNGITEDQARLALGRLKSTSDITIKTTNRFSIVSIANYEIYQAETPSKKPNKSPDEPPTNPQQTPTIKECKNDKNEKNKGNPFFWEFKKLYPNCIAFKRTKGVFDKLNPDDALWGVMRKAILEQKESKSWKQGYVPASFKWLEEERWKDSVGKKTMECPF